MKSTNEKLKTDQGITEKTPGKKRNGIENLRPPWKPGETGNPMGRPQGKSMVTILRELLDKNMLMPTDPITGEATDSGRLSIREILMMQLVSLGIKGDRHAIESILDRLEGRGSQGVEVSGGMVVGNLTLEERSAQIMSILGISGPPQK